LIKRHIILLILFVSTACTLFHPHANTNPTAVFVDDSAEKILYCSESDNGQEIYIIGIDGSNPVGLTNAPPNTRNCESLVWHPNGQQIAFLSDRDKGHRQMYQMNVDGSNLLNLTAEYDVSDDFSWSPDGKSAVFTASDGIYTMRADGSERRKLQGYYLTIPYWSPNSQFIAFVAEENGKDAIYVTNADGTGLRQVSRSQDSTIYSSLYLDWSPDSQKIAFRAMLDGDNYEIAVVNQDGSGEKILTNNPGRDDFPNWSPDGHRIAFRSDVDGNLEIYTMNADGSNQVRLTHNSTRDYEPQWSPDGTRIAFVSGDWGNSQVFVMAADGSARTQLTYDAGAKCCISWRP